MKNLTPPSVSPPPLALSPGSADRFQIALPRLGSFLLAASFILLLAGCRPRLPVPGPSQPVVSLLTLTGEIKRHTMHDFYRRPWPRDAAGYNPFRSGLVRLANFRQLYPGREADVAAFLEGECLFFLRAYGEAADAFAECARIESPLREAALARRSQAIEFAQAAALPADLETLDDLLQALRENRSRTRELLERYPDPPLRALARLEVEAADVAWARFLTDYMSVAEEGAAGAARAWAEVIDEHRESYQVMRHRLALGRLNEELALNYVEAHPPESAGFETEIFQRLAGRAREYYLQAATADGYAERPLGEARLASVNALIEESLAAAE